jgi:plasmid stabilization system protein ParE
MIIWTAPALEDLDEIADYIALDNVGAAQFNVCSGFRQST